MRLLSGRRTSTGPSPAPSSARPLRTASDAARAASRAASSSGQSPGEACCERGRMRAAGAVRRSDVVPLDRDLDVALAVEEMIDRRRRRDLRSRATAARPELVDPLGELAARARPSPPAPPPRAGSASRRSRAETGARRASSTASSCSSLRTRARDHHRVDDERDVSAPRAKSATVSITSREKSMPVFAASTPRSSKHRVELCANERPAALRARPSRRRVLRRQRDDRAHAVAARSGEGLQIGLDPCSAARVRAGDRQTSWNQTLSLRRS